MKQGLEAYIIYGWEDVTEKMSEITQNYQRIRKSIPEYVSLVVATKTRSEKEILRVIEAGATDIGENYVQEALKKYNQLAEKAKQVKWHMIGHLQRNKINKAIRIFDVIQTVDSFKLAKSIDKRAKKVVPIFIEINSGRELQKTGVMSEDVEELIKQISCLKNIRIGGLMTMGPRFGNPEDSRPYFRETRKIFDKLKANSGMNVLSMGMSNSYKVAIQEGSNMVRIGSKIFGKRK